MTDRKSHHRRLLPTGVDQDVAAFPGIVPHATPPGTPWNWTAIRLDQRCPILPGITPGLEDCLRCCPPWNPLDLDDSPPGSTSPHLPGIIPGPQDSTFLAAASEGYIHTTRYCVCLAENSFIPPGIVHMFQRTVFIPPGIVRMFQRSSYTTWYCAYFQRTVFIPPGIVSALKRTSFYTKWYFKCFSENSFSTPPHGLAFPDEVSTPGIVSRKSELSF